jgi:hypothetical protein
MFASKGSWRSLEHAANMRGSRTVLADYAPGNCASALPGCTRAALSVRSRYLRPKNDATAMITTIRPTI